MLLHQQAACLMTERPAKYRGGRKKDFWCNSSTRSLGTQEWCIWERKKKKEEKSSASNYCLRLESCFTHGHTKQPNPRGNVARPNLCARFPEDQGHVTYLQGKKKKHQQTCYCYLNKQSISVLFRRFRRGGCTAVSGGKAENPEALLNIKIFNFQLYHNK